MQILMINYVETIRILFPVSQSNEVATDYNAGFQSAVAGLNKAR